MQPKGGVRRGSPRVRFVRCGSQRRRLILCLRDMWTDGRRRCGRGTNEVRTGGQVGGCSWRDVGGLSGHVSGCCAVQMAARLRDDGAEGVQIVVRTVATLSLGYFELCCFLTRGLHSAAPHSPYSKGLFHRLSTPSAPSARRRYDTRQVVNQRGSRTAT